MEDKDGQKEKHGFPPDTLTCGNRVGYQLTMSIEGGLAGFLSLGYPKGPPAVRLHPSHTALALGQPVLSLIVRISAEKYRRIIADNHQMGTDMIETGIVS